MQQNSTCYFLVLGALALACIEARSDPSLLTGDALPASAVPAAGGSGESGGSGAGGGGGGGTIGDAGWQGPADGPEPGAGDGPVPSGDAAAGPHLTVVITGPGRVKLQGESLDCTAGCAASFPPGTRVLLTAQPEEGARFVGWTGACTGTADCRVTVDGVRTVTATFRALVAWRTSVGAYMGEIVATADSIYVASAFRDTVDFGGMSLTSTTDQDIGLARYDVNGKLQWVRAVVGATYDVPLSLAVAPDGDVLLTGRCQAPQIQVGSISVTPPSIGGGFYAFIARYSPDGAVRWAGPKEMGYGRAVFDRTGNIITNGPFGSVAGSVTKMDAGGNLLWALPAGFAVDPETVLVNPADEIFVCGRLDTPLTLPGGQTLTPTGAVADFALVKLSPRRELLWGFSFPAVTKVTWCPHLALDPRGDLLVSGSFDGVIRLEGKTVTSAGDNDILLAKFAGADGKVLWTKTLGSVGFDWGLPRISPAGEYLLGVASGNLLDLGGGSMMGSQLVRLSGAGAYMGNLPVSTGSFSTFAFHPSGDLILGGPDLARVSVP